MTHVPFDLVASNTDADSDWSRPNTTTPRSAGLPEQVILHALGLFPEAVAWDAARDRFLVTSVTRGTVTAVRDDGSHELFSDGAGLTSANAVVLDATRGRLLVAGGDFHAALDPSRPGEVKLAIYDLASGERTHLIDLAVQSPSGRHLGNGVTVDQDGNAYVTDTLSPVIYRVTPDGIAGILVTDPRFDAAGDFGLNGIQYHPGGFLLVAMSRKMYRVPLDAPTHFTEVILSAPFAADNLALRSDGHLFAAAPFDGAAFELASDDDWRSTRIVGRMTTSIAATTTGMTLRDDVPYALNAHFAEMSKQPSVSDFEIFRVRTI